MDRDHDVVALGNGQPARAQHGRDGDAGAAFRFRNQVEDGAESHEGAVHGERETKFERAGGVAVRRARGIRSVGDDGAEVGQSLILTGGSRTPSDALVGPVAVESLRGLHVDLLFLGVHGMTLGAGLTTPNLVEAATNRALVAAAARTVVTADHSKWGVVGLSSFGRLEEVECLVTDAALAPEVIERIRGVGCQVVVPDPGVGSYGLACNTLTLWWRNGARGSPHEAAGVPRRDARPVAVRPVRDAAVEVVVAEGLVAVAPLPHRHRPDLLAAVEASFQAPSLYDEALRLLARRGIPVPAVVLERDVTAPYVADAGVTTAWEIVYRDPDAHWELYQLGEELVDLEDAFRLWRFRHLTTVARIIGVKRGTGCLLYTSDAADERSSVDLGGRRIIKKKNQARRESVWAHRNHTHMSLLNYCRHKTTDTATI